jgi:hypothetical protein
MRFTSRLLLANYTDRDNAREEFLVTPQEGASDPVAPYLRVIQVQAGSFNFNRKPLSETPVTVRMNLNQWIRFDQSGTYHVSVVRTCREITGATASFGRGSEAITEPRPEGSG